MAPKRRRKKKARRKGQGPHGTVLLNEIALSGEPLDLHGPPVAELQRQAVALLRQGYGRKAEVVLRQALELEPDAPDLLNNLALAYELQGRQQESYDLVQQIHRKHPDYLFGRTNMVHLCLRSGDMAQARTLLGPLLLRKRMHLSEYSAVCSAQIALAVADADLASARHWYRTWQQMVPDHPGLAQWRKKLFGTVT
jgi:tetratricopeptide (TPR) repeat protein